MTYDSGNYEPALDKALAAIGYDQFRQEQAAARQQGRYLGIGMSTYIEICGLAPSKVLGAVGGGAGGWESATVRVHPTGKVTSSPARRRTARATRRRSPRSSPTSSASRSRMSRSSTATPTRCSSASAPSAAAAWRSAARRSSSPTGKIVDKARKIAAHLLEAAEADLDFENGVFRVKGAPDRTKTIQDVALMAFLAHNYPEGLEPGLEAQSFYDPTNFTWPFGAHIAIVEIDADTGKVQLKRYVAVDDCGNVINPLLADGQVHGGVTQGVAQALFEGAVYDENGQLLTGSMMDYVVPRASELPTYELDHTYTPSPVNPLGVKGIGEAGTIASSAAVINAVVDALSPLGVRHVDMPVRSERIWRIIQDAKGGEVTMYPSQFDYYRANSVDEALQLLGEHEGAKLVAGGHSLLPLMKLRLLEPTALIDIGRVPGLAGVKLNGGATIGALTTYRQLVEADGLSSRYAALVEAAANVGDIQVRNRGTVGGAVAHADPASDLPAVMLAYDATFTAVGKSGWRKIQAGSFFIDVLTTALEPGEVLTEITLPELPPSTGSAYVKFPHPASGYAIVGVAAVVGVSGGSVQSARVAVTGAAGGEDEELPTGPEPAQ